MLTCALQSDSNEIGEARRRELQVSREFAAELGRSVVEATQTGSYPLDDGGVVDWAALVDAAVAGKVSIAPDDPLPDPRGGAFAETRVEVCNETTLGAARRLVDRGFQPLALNFANGLHPGGGFLHGARAQEEVLCRSSALFATLVGDPMYDAHAQRHLPDSSDWLVYSPQVPVFRTDDGTTLDEPWLLDFVTGAAPYAPTVGQPRSGDLLQKRIHRVLAVARAYGHSALVLGAWGCGAFRNDPVRTARDFRHALENEFRGAFEVVTFAVTDWSPERRYLGPFRETFANLEVNP